MNRTGKVMGKLSLIPFCVFGNVETVMETWETKGSKENTES